MELIDLRQSVNDLLCQAVGKDFVLWICAHADEGKHSNGITRVGAWWTVDVWLARDDGSDKAIATARESLDETWPLRRIIEREPQFLDGVVETMVKIDKRVGGPDALLKLPTRHNFAGILHEDPQDMEGLLLQSDLQPVFAQFSTLEVKLEDVEANGPA